jgi:hypothetical protein
MNSATYFFIFPSPFEGAYYHGLIATVNNIAGAAVSAAVAGVRLSMSRYERPGRAQASGSRWELRLQAFDGGH